MAATPRLTTHSTGAESAWLYKVFLFVFFLHFFLIFPERSPLLRRFPLIGYLIYLPILFISLPYDLLPALCTAGWLVTVNLSLPGWLLPLTTVVGLSYPSACLSVLIFTSVSRPANEYFHIYSLQITSSLMPELTGRQRLYQAFNLADDKQADSAPVE